MAVEWSRPRVIALAGHRKATESYCNDCQVWHKTHRAIGEEICEALRGSRNTVVPPFHIRQVPRTSSK